MVIDLQLSNTNFPLKSVLAMSECEAADAAIAVPQYPGRRAFSLAVEPALPVHSTASPP